MGSAATRTPPARWTLSCAAWRPGWRSAALPKVDVLALFSSNCPEYPIVFLAVALLGGATTMINPSYTVDELVYQLNDAGARYLVAAPTTVEKEIEGRRRSRVEEVFVLDEPPVADAAVITARDEEAGDVPKAFVALKPGAIASADELMAYVAERVAPYKRITSVFDGWSSSTRCPSHRQGRSCGACWWSASARGEPDSHTSQPTGSACRSTRADTQRACLSLRSPRLIHVYA